VSKFTHDLWGDTVNVAAEGWKLRVLRQIQVTGMLLKELLKDLLLAFV
jgi:hypothetical protein